MDLLSQRYADPYLILNDFIRLGQLHEFSQEIMKTISEEKINEIRWDYYLHKVWDMNFEEYVASCDGSKKQDETMQAEDAVNIIKDSNRILEEFSL